MHSENTKSLDSQNQSIALDLDEYVEEDVEIPPEEQLPVTPAQIQTAVLNSKKLRTAFSQHETIANAYWLTLDGERYAVTFDRDLFDQYPETLRLLSYQEDLFTRLLESIPEPDSSDIPVGILRLANDDPALRGYFSAQSHDRDDHEKGNHCLRRSLAFESSLARRRL